jgi:hypothetical protein
MAVTPENRKLFENLGFERVRSELLSGGEDALKGNVVREQARQWISEQERNERRRIVIIGKAGLVIGLLTLVASAIAASPTAIGWIKALQ